MNSGKLTILVILIVAVLMGGSAWLYQFQRGRQLQKAWGMDNLLLIHEAPQVELIVLANTQSLDSQGDTFSIDGADWLIEKRIDLSQTNGLINARAPLVRDHSYLWEPGESEAEQSEAEQSESATQWAFAIRFKDATSQATLAFSTKQSRIMLLERNSIVAVKPKLMQSFGQFATAVITLDESKKAAEADSPNHPSDKSKDTALQPAS
ncbi:MAG: hypothetical protein ACI9G1_002201 [Pirellulaceae bacterium]|jgi:hypothetical protein